MLKAEAEAIVQQLSDYIEAILDHKGLKVEISSTYGEINDTVAVLIKSENIEIPIIFSMPEGDFYMPYNEFYCWEISNPDCLDEIITTLRFEIKRTIKSSRRRQKKRKRK